MSTTIAPPESDVSTFQKLNETWEEETWFLSDPSAIIAHPAHDEIVAMGASALPLIMRELQERPSIRWFSVLREITGENPVPSDIAGRVEAIADAWIVWGRVHGWVS